MHKMSTAERAPQATAMVVQRAVVAGELLDEHTRIEPFLMLEDDGGSTRVRRLTIPEKLAHSERTGASVFMADEREQEELFDLLKNPADDE
jgi:hypothetical protein